MTVINAMNFVVTSTGSGRCVYIGVVHFPKLSDGAALTLRIERESVCLSLMLGLCVGRETPCVGANEGLSMLRQY